MNDAPRTDPELVAGLRAGRADAFARLYADYRAPLFNLCARILGDRDEAQDVTQEVFAAAFEKLPPAAEGTLHLRAWLYRVATNACLNRLRKAGRTVSDGDRLEAVADRVDGFQRAETAALVEASLAEMSERYRTVLVLKDLHGLPPAEIAEVLAVSRPAVDVLVHRARTSFKAAFARLGGTSPAPASLAVALVPFALPAALQPVPPAPVLAAPGPPPPPVAPMPPVAPAPAFPDLSTIAGPATAGLLTKIGAALTTKAAIGAAAAAVVVGGGVAAVRDVERGHHTTPAAAASARAGEAASGGDERDHRAQGHGAVMPGGHTAGHDAAARHAAARRLAGHGAKAGGAHSSRHDGSRATASGTGVDAGSGASGAAASAAPGAGMDGGGGHDSGGHMGAIGAEGGHGSGQEMDAGPDE